jgi:hypothetical protein
MRKFAWLAGLTLAAGLAESVHAQVITFGPVVGQITNAQVDYRNANAPIGGPTYRPPGFRLSNLFPSVARISNTIQTPHSTFPTPAQMNAAAPLYFKPFQLYRGQRIQP